MTRLHRIGRAFAALSASAAMVVLPVASALAEDLQPLPNLPSAHAHLKPGSARPGFAAKIMPRQGYRGRLMFGHVPDLSASIKPAATRPNDFYPQDLSYFGGPVVTAASHVNVYWGAANGAVWGYPAQYENALNHSRMIAMLNAYTGNPPATNGTYPVATYGWAGGSPGTLIYDSQIAAQAQFIATYDRAHRGAALEMGTIYHFFLPPATDACFDDASQGCYNPDGAAPGPFAFCGYHSNTTLPDGTNVLYTVEPYQTVYGCSDSPTTASDTANVLGHEIAETITDPLPGYGWVGAYATNYGSEIGDECSWQMYTHTLTPSASYVTQNWYSNRLHNCSDLP